MQEILENRPKYIPGMLTPFDEREDEITVTKSIKRRKAPIPIDMPKISCETGIDASPVPTPNNTNV